VTMRPDSRRRLQAFVARVDEIETYTVFEKRDNIAGLRAHEVDGQWVIDSYGPSREQLAAVLHHLRVFYRRDDISIGRMEELYDDPDVSEAWKTEHRRWRAELNARLDRVAAEGDARGVLTHRQVLDMFLYGRLGHFREQDEGYRRYDTWVTDETSRAILLDTFHEAVIWILAIVHNIAVASREELTRAEH
jgi:hypothetical protein